MKLRHLVMAGILAAGVAIPATAEAAIATGTVNLRTGPGTGYDVVAAIPAGSFVRANSCSNWCKVSFEGMRGWVSVNYIARGGLLARQPLMLKPVIGPLMSPPKGYDPFSDPFHQY